MNSAHQQRGTFLGCRGGEAGTPVWLLSDAPTPDTNKRGTQEAFHMDKFKRGQGILIILDGLAYVYNSNYISISSTNNA